MGDEVGVSEIANELSLKHVPHLKKKSKWNAIIG